MKFEELFPELKNMVEDGELKTKEEISFGEYIWLPMVRRHCISKQKVKEAIDKLFPTDDEHNASAIIDNGRLKKELSLDK